MSDAATWADRIAQAVQETVARRYCHPRATYRLQFDAEKLTFSAATAIVPYLADLGISHIYASPCLRIRPGSGNGYAVVDYTQLNPELGGDEAYESMVAALHKHGMGQIFDTVPNHMCAAPGENRWWTDVLENGPASPQAAFFDIDWQPVKEELRNRLLLPVLGDQYGAVLESGELKLEYRDGAFCLNCYQVLLPLDPSSYRMILGRGLEPLRTALPADSPDLLEFESILTALEHLPGRLETDVERLAERLREKEVIKGRLRALTARSTEVAECIARTVEQFNGTPGDPHSFDHLDRLLDAQVYRLSHWKAAADEINYRRFFDINELAAVCMEAPEVFTESHRRVFELLVHGDIDGLRIDHIDGLYDPMEYLRNLQKEYLLALGRAEHARWSDAASPWAEIEPQFLAQVTSLTCTDSTALPLYVVVEKILAAEEPLPEQWLVAGTTGYEFLNLLGGLFVDPAGYVAMRRIYGRFVDQRRDFPAVAEEAKLLIFHTAMSSDLQLLAHRLNRISERHRRWRDFTLNTLRVALREILVLYPIYRTYIREGYVPHRDQQVIARAVARAKHRNPASSGAVFDFLRDLLLLQTPPDLEESVRHERGLFVGRVQQVTSPLTAKGIEDTAFYRWFPLASLNEVGGDPGRGVVSLDEFHRQNCIRQESFPRSLLASTTHDSKRSEDVRARISVLAEIPQMWQKRVNRWARWNRRHRRDVEGLPAPSRNDEYLLYQTLVGAWPLDISDAAARDVFTARTAAYMEKATREAKLRTSWINPNAEYDTAVRGFVTAVLAPAAKNRFLADLQQFHEEIVNWGLYTALAQLLIKLTAPGVPDIYQGQELWDFSLVDPDNRHTVDFALRQRLLDEVRTLVGDDAGGLMSLAQRLAQDPRDPRIKLFVTWRTLLYRREHAELFRRGDYRPLEVRGARAQYVCAFARRRATEHGLEMALTIVPRLVAELTPPPGDGRPAPAPLGSAVWEDTHVLLDGKSAPLRNQFTGEEYAVTDGRILLASALGEFPVALLST